MSGLIAKMVTKRILGETMTNKFGTEDPYFEQVPATRLDGRPNGKMKRRKKALPPGISEHDGRVLTKVKRRAYRLDYALFNCCGIRFGWGSVIGIVPFIGDAGDALLALMVLNTCRQIDGGLPASLRVQMMMNVIVDFVIGLVPFAGDIADALFKANTRNAALLEKHLRDKGKKNLRVSGLPIPAIDPSDPEEFDRAQREGSPDHVATQPSRHDDMRASRAPSYHTTDPRAPSYHSTEPRAPETARVREDRGFFGWGRSRPRDVEMGQDATSDTRRQGNSRR